MAPNKGWPSNAPCSKLIISRGSCKEEKFNQDEWLQALAISTTLGSDVVARQDPENEHFDSHICHWVFGTLHGGRVFCRFLPSLGDAFVLQSSLLPTCGFHASFQTLPCHALLPIRSRLPDLALPHSRSLFGWFLRNRCLPHVDVLTGGFFHSSSCHVCLVAPKTGSKKTVETWRPEKDLDCTVRLQKADSRSFSANTQAIRRNETITSNFKWVQAATDIHPACPNKKQLIHKTACSKPSQNWLRSKGPPYLPVPFLGLESQLKSGFACAGLLCSNSMLLLNKRNCILCCTGRPLLWILRFCGLIFGTARQSQNGTVKVLFLCSFTNLCMWSQVGLPVFLGPCLVHFSSFLHQGCRSAMFCFQ